MTATFNARPTIYKGIQMRSRLEAGFAAWLDHRQAVWAYEPHAFAHPELGQYLPDFQVENVIVPHPRDRNVRLYVEVKPAGFWLPSWEDAYLEASRLATIVGDNEPDAQFAVCSPGQAGGYPGQLLCFAHSGKVGFEAAWQIALRRTGVGVCIPALPGDGPWHGEWWKGTTT